jgi:transposase
MDLLPLLLPSPSCLHLENWRLDAEQQQITVQVTSIQPLVRCPLCQSLSERIHSHYQRTLKDLPCQEMSLVLHLNVRKFRCLNGDCPRRIFSERLPEMVLPWARRTLRLSALLSAVGFVVGGAAGARLTERLRCKSSRNTLLRVVTRLPLAPMKVPRILGVDDFAFRKGRHYGTILVDLERHQPIALLPNRDAETLAQWLRDHPGVEVISRDRALAYKQGASLGAPEAQQVVDRFHLFQNLADVLIDIFQQQLPRRKLPRPKPAEPSVSPVVELPPPEREPRDLSRTQQVRARRLATYQQIWQAHQAGIQQTVIAQHLGVSEKTVYRYLQQPTFRERPERQDRGRCRLDPYRQQILQRWNAGCRDGRVLYQELKQQGCATSYSSVSRFCRRLRQAQGLPKGVRKPQAAPKPVSVSQPPMLTPQKAAWLILAHPEVRQPDEERQLRVLQTQCPPIDEAVRLAQGFVEMVRHRQPEGLEDWLTQASQSECPAWVRFAKGLRGDYDALKAALELPWSNGPVEGQVNRLKLLKRQMYGRANLPLLTKRFLEAA